MKKKIFLVFILIILISAGVTAYYLIERVKPLPGAEPSVKESPSCFDPNQNPIPICNCLDLQKMSENMAADYELKNDIDCSETKNWNQGKGFEPISSDSDSKSEGYQGRPFLGTFNGQNYTVSNLFINRPDEDYVGLFGYSKAKISNVRLKDISLSGRHSVGGIAGTNLEGIVEKCEVKGILTGTEDVGGLIGENKEGGIIRKSSADIILFNCYKDIGGLVGENEGTIINSYVSGNVSGYKDIGGLVGDNKVAAAFIDNSYSLVNVTGNEKYRRVGW